jgi:hypothetical protein
MNDQLQQRAPGYRRRRRRVDMRVAEVRVMRATFGAVLGAMREWLDRNESRPVYVETAADDGGVITITARFDSDDLAEKFRRAFDGSSVPLAKPAPERKAPPKQRPRNPTPISRAAPSPSTLSPRQGIGLSDAATLNRHPRA